MYCILFVLCIYVCVCVCIICLYCMVQILKPMMLRRLKEDVEKSIAPKEETIIEVCT